MNYRNDFRPFGTSQIQVGHSLRRSEGESWKIFSTNAINKYSAITFNFPLNPPFDLYYGYLLLFFGSPSPQLQV